jgi:hypothetical protein
MATRKRAPKGDTGDTPTGEGVVEADGETYLSVERAAAYLGKGRSTMFAYIKRYGWESYSFPLQGKRLFLRLSDVETLRRPTPQPRQRQDTKGGPA